MVGLLGRDMRDQFALKRKCLRQDQRDNSVLISTHPSVGQFLFFQDLKV